MVRLERYMRNLFSRQGMGRSSVGVAVEDGKGRKQIKKAESYTGPRLLHVQLMELTVLDA